MGHTITVTNATRTGIFGDLGEGALIKNLGLVATLTTNNERPAALASIAKGGAVIENCWFDVTAGSNTLNYNGLLFAGVGSIVMRNCVVVGTPGNSGDQMSGLLSGYTHPNYTEGGAGDEVFTFENIVAVSRNAANQDWIRVQNETTAVVYDTGVTVIDGSAENFDITAYELTGFDASGFNTEYFTVTENRIPQWKSAAE